MPGPDAAFDVDEDDERYDDGASASPSPRRGAAGGRPPRPASAPAAGAGPSSSTMITLALPGVRLPYAAAHPRAAAEAEAGAAASLAARTRETLIVQRSARGVAALTPVEYPSARDKDFSRFYKAPKALYDKDFLNEMAYCLDSKEKLAAKRAEEDRRARAAFVANKALVLSGGKSAKAKPPPAEDPNSPAALSAFFERQDNVEKRRVQGRDEAQELANYNNYNPDKKVCGKCGGVQSYAEVKGKVKRCPKESCGGAPYRPKLMWGEVQGAFLGRWSNFIKETAANLAKSAEELKPPFRVTHKKTFDKETGEMVMEELPKLDWDAVGDDFLVRQQAVLDKAKARQAAALKSKAEPIVFVKEKGPKSKWKPSKPFPDFHTRQAAMLEKKGMSFEDRLAVMQGGGE